MSALLSLAAVLPVSACGSDGEDTGTGASTTPETAADPPLRVETSEGPRGTEVIVFVTAAANRSAVAGGKRMVELRCFGGSRKVIVSKSHPWPFTDTDGGLTDAHVHQRVPRTEARRVSRCELDGTRGPLSGEVTSSGFE